MDTENAQQSALTIVQRPETAPPASVRGEKATPLTLVLASPVCESVAHS